MATNYPQELVPQLDRRCTVKVPFALPSESARLRIWQLHLGKAPLAADVDLARLAREYPMPGGYIKNAAQTAVNEALAREGEVALNRADLEAACQLQEDRVCEGPRVGRRYRPQQRVEDLIAGEELRERLRGLALALVRKEEGPGLLVGVRRARDSAEPAFCSRAGGSSRPWRRPTRWRRRWTGRF